MNIHQRLVFINHFLREEKLNVFILYSDWLRGFKKVNYTIEANILHAHLHKIIVLISLLIYSLQSYTFTTTNINTIWKRNSKLNSSPLLYHLQREEKPNNNLIHLRVVVFINVPSHTRAFVSYWLLGADSLLLSWIPKARLPMFYRTHSE